MLRIQVLLLALPCLVLASLATNVAAAANLSMTEPTLEFLDDYISKLSDYGAQIESVRLAPAFNNLGKAVALMLQQNYAKKMGGQKMIAGADGSRRLLDISPSQTFTPPGCSNLGCSCTPGVGLNCYGFYNLFWFLGCPCAQTTAPCTYDIVAGDSAAIADPAFNRPIQRASRCPITISDSTTATQYDCKNRGCRARFTTRSCTTNCNNPCSPTQKMICVPDGTVVRDLPVPTTQEVRVLGGDSFTQESAAVEPCTPGTPNCAVNVPVTAPVTCSGTECQNPTSVPNKVCKYYQPYTGTFPPTGISTSPIPSAACSAATGWTAITPTCNANVP